MRRLNSGASQTDRAVSHALCHALASASSTNFQFVWIGAIHVKPVPAATGFGHCPSGSNCPRPGLCGCGLARGTLGLARANPAGIIVLLAVLAALGFVWSRRSLQRESVEYGMQRELAVYFKSVNNLKRAAIFEHKADVLKESKEGPRAVQ